MKYLKEVLFQRIDYNPITIGHNGLRRFTQLGEVAFAVAWQDDPVNKGEYFKN
jgi:hypothetical protein